MAGTGTVANQPTAGQVASTAPLPVQDFGNIASVDPTYANAAAAISAPQAQAAYGQAAYGQAALVNPQQNQQYLDQYAALVQQQLNPTFQTQDQQLQDASAARGISSSGAAGELQTELQGQQGSALASAISPLVQQEAGYTQQDIAQNQANQQAVYSQDQANQQAVFSQDQADQQAVNLANPSAQLQAEEFNAGNQQQVNLTNAAASNAAANTNAGYYSSAVGQNAADYNQYLAMLYNTGANQAGGELSAYLNSFGPNTGVENTIGTAEGAAGNAYTSIYGQQTGAENGQMENFGNAFGQLFTGGATGAGAGGGFDYAEAATAGGG